MQDQSAQVLIAAPAAATIYPKHYVSANSEVKTHIITVNKINNSTSLLNTSSSSSSISNNQTTTNQFVILPKSESFHSRTVLEQLPETAIVKSLSNRTVDSGADNKLLRNKIVKQKSDYSLSTRKNRNLYENLFHETVPLIEASCDDNIDKAYIGSDCNKAIKVRKDDKSVLVFTKKQQQQYPVDIQKSVVIGKRIDGSGGGSNGSVQESSLGGGL